jgi:3-oxoacyl-[acyl-carrier-protein] synthase II
MPAKAPRVWITGLGCVSPAGLGLEVFQKSVLQGAPQPRRISLFDASLLPVQIAGEVPDFPLEDYLDEKERRHLGRAPAFAFAAADEAWRRAGIEPSRLTKEERRRCAVLIGSGGGFCEFTEKQYGAYFLEGKTPRTAYAIPSSTMGNLSSELSIRYGLLGPSLVLSTGCTSSTDAMGAALELVLRGGADLVLAGGVDAAVTPAVMTGFCQMGVLAHGWEARPGAASRPFSADRNGFVLSEGAWFFMLESEARARARGASPWAELAGYAATCDGRHRVRNEESGEEAARAMRLALDDAGEAAEGLDYLNLHGTSTVLNDLAETHAVKLLLGKAAFRIPCSSTKSVMGHPQGASGAMGAAAALCAMKENFLPPTANLDVPDPRCDLDYVPLQGRPARMDLALCNCLGFGSKNAALVLRRVS